MNPLLEQLNLELDMKQEENYDSMEEVVEDLEEKRSKNKEKSRIYGSAGVGVGLTTICSRYLINNFYSYQKVLEELGTSEAGFNLSMWGIGGFATFGLAYLAAEQKDEKDLIEGFLDAYHKDELEKYLTAERGMKIADYLSEDYRTQIRNELDEKLLDE